MWLSLGYLKDVIHFFLSLASGNRHSVVNVQMVEKNLYKNLYTVNSSCQNIYSIQIWTVLLQCECTIKTLI